MGKGNVVLEISGENRGFVTAMKRSERQVAALEAKLKQTKETGKQTGKVMGDAFSPTKLARFLGMLTGVGGVTAALAMVNKGYDVWLQNMREISTEAKKFSNDIVAFAALQAGGTKAAAVQQASRLAQQYGISSRGEAFNTVQALQSAPGSNLQKGLQAARAVFAGTQVGIPIEMGRELEVLGATQGQAPGQAIRRAYAAGQASSRDPATLARAAAGLAFYKDKEFGFAAAGVLAGGVRPEQLETYVKAGGIALSKTSSAGFQKTFKRLGVSDATQFEKLKALAAAGITTTEDLALAGLSEMRQQQAVATLASNIPNLERIRGEIRSRAVPGLLGAQRREVEAELPNMRAVREIGMVETLERDATATGPLAGKALQVEFGQKLRAAAMRRLGEEQLGPFDLIQDGKVTGRNMLPVRIMELLGHIARQVVQARGGVGGATGVADLTTFGGATDFLGEPTGRVSRIEAEEAKIRGELGVTTGLSETVAEKLIEAAEKLFKAAERMGGGPTLVPVNVDK